MKFKFPGKAALILLSTLFLSPNIAIAHLDDNTKSFSGCHRDVDISTKNCNQDNSNSSSKDKAKSNIFHAFPLTFGGLIVFVFIVYLLYNAVMILILIGRLIFFQISDFLKKH